jgi:branched-chain amino acid transport system ATP-binding protein
MLEVTGLTVRYGGVVAVNDLSFSVPAGRIVGLIGPNGAGKTTTMDALGGFAECSGRVELAGTTLDGLAPHRRAALGLGRTFQGIDLYEDLTVEENVAVGQHLARDRSRERVETVLGVVGMGAYIDQLVSELSQGQRQLVSIARALAGEPRLLLLDEPAAGLDSTESQWLADRLRDVCRSGVTILLIDHDMSLVLGLCDEIHVLDFGSHIAAGEPVAIRDNPRVAAAYLGASGRPPVARIELSEPVVPPDPSLRVSDVRSAVPPLSKQFSAHSPAPSSEVLGCRDLCAGYDKLVVVRGLDVELKRNEILAVLGPNGAGKTTLLLTLAGFLSPAGGTILIDGNEVRPGSARRMNRAGVVLVPDFRALFTGLTPIQNLKLAYHPGGATPDEVFDLFPGLALRAKLRAGDLSGGEQQMLAVGRALVQAPRVLLIDEMSMGLAPIVVESLMPLIRKVADETEAAVVLVEQHVQLALEVADKAVVLAHGDVVSAGTSSQIKADAHVLEAAYLGKSPSRLTSPDRA